jgi:1,2-diacylglycerol 3-beta-galactosyltransferase
MFSILQYSLFLQAASFFSASGFFVTPQRIALKSKTFHQHRNILFSSSENNDSIMTIQILMSDTGGGHRASANALRDALDVLYPGRFHCDIVDIYTDYGPFWPFNDYVNGYKLMAANPWTWDIFYRFGATDFGICVNEVLLETFCFDAFRKCLERPSGNTGKRADMVVSVHPLTQGLPLRILADLDSGSQDGCRTTPFCTVVTDLGSAHPTWFNPKVDKCFVPSDALNTNAQKRGLKTSQIVQYGLPIRRGFWDTESTSSGGDKQTMRNKLDLEKGLPVVLVVGGGDGMGGIVEISRELGKKLGSSDIRSQMVVVCGKNEAAKSELERVSWGDGVEVQIKGFVYNMDEWMKASDVLVTKAGPGSTYDIYD